MKKKHGVCQENTNIVILVATSGVRLINVIIIKDFISRKMKNLFQFI